MTIIQLHLNSIFNCSWEKVVEFKYAVQPETGTAIAPADLEAVSRLHSVPPNWSLAYDEVLAQYLSENAETSNENLGSVKNYVEKIDVSSFCVWCLNCIDYIIAIIVIFHTVDLQMF